MRTDLLNRIIEKGGIYACAAMTYMDDPKKSDQFIAECFEQCHNVSTHEHWGVELVMDIISYRLSSIRMQMKELLADHRAFAFRSVYEINKTNIDIHLNVERKRKIYRQFD